MPIRVRVTAAGPTGVAPEVVVLLSAPGRVGPLRRALVKHFQPAEPLRLTCGATVLDDDNAVLAGPEPSVEAAWGPAVSPPTTESATLAEAYQAGYALAQAQLALQAAVASALRVVPPWSPVLAGPPPPPLATPAGPPPPPPPPVVVVQNLTGPGPAPAHAAAAAAADNANPPPIPAAAAAAPAPVVAPERNNEWLRAVANQLGLMARLFLLLAILGQGASRERQRALAATFVVIFLWQGGWLRAWFGRPPAVPPRPVPAAAAAAAAAAAVVPAAPAADLGQAVPANAAEPPQPPPPPPPPPPPGSVLALVGEVAARFVQTLVPRGHAPGNADAAAAAAAAAEDDDEDDNQ